MKEFRDKTKEALLVTDVIRSCLRLSARAVKTGNRLVKDFGLTSSKWQLMGELYFAESLFTMSGLSRQMGLSRQAVQKLARVMIKDNIIETRQNPDDFRAPFLALTVAGSNLYRQTIETEGVFTNQVGNFFDAQELRVAMEVLDRLADHMD